MTAPGIDGARAVSFDLDDTFWDCAPVIARAEGVLEDWLRREAPAVLEHHDRDSIAAARLRLLEANPALAGDVTELRKRSLAELFREARAEHALSERAFEVFYRARSEVTLYDGVDELLTELAPRYRVAAITNGNADLGIVGIAERFELVLKASLEWSPKPDTPMFEAVFERFGIEPGELVHVGDNAVTDVGGAHAAGARAAWFNPPGAPWDPGHGPAPEFEIDSIAALRALLLGR